jgi:hypothetical protein
MTGSISTRRFTHASACVPLQPATSPSAKARHFSSRCSRSIACGAIVSPQFLGVLFADVAVTAAYSVYLRIHTLIDVLQLATLYTVRVIAGSMAIMVIPTFWLLTFSMCTFSIFQS